MSETPDDLLYAASHEWSRKLDDNIIEVGITDFAQQALGDVVYIELPEMGQSVSATQECCAVESVKAASDIYAPVSGEIIAVNEKLEDEPELLNESPFNDGWMFRIKATDTTELRSIFKSSRGLNPMQITLKGNPINLEGSFPEVGSTAPDFSLTTDSLSDVGLNEYAGKKKVISILPSLDTPVCATSTQKFNTEVASKDDVQLLVVSADLPFAAKRFCEANSAGDTQTLSTMRNNSFANDYGVLMADGPLAGLTARAVLVLDQDNKVLHAELVPEIAQEPNYDAALAAL